MKNILLSICLLSIVQIVAAQVNKFDRIALITDGSLQLISVTINDQKEPVYFMFDTGSEITAIDENYAQHIGLKYSGNAEVTGVTGSETYKQSKGNTIKLSDKTVLKNITFTALSQTGHSSNYKIAGIIGADILKNFITRLNFDEAAMLLAPFGSKWADAAAYTKISFTHTGDYFPCVPVSVTLVNGEVFSGNAFFDSGAGFAFMMNTPYAAKTDALKKSGKYLERPNNSINEESYNYITRAKSINIAGVAMPAFPMDISQSKTGVSSYEDYMGMLGFDIIKRFNVVIDAQNKLLYLKKNKNFNAPYWFPVTGMVFKQDGERMLIDYVMEDKSIFKKGDEVLSLNSKPIASADEATDKMFSAFEGDKFTITYKNEKGEIKTGTFITKGLL